VRSIAINASFVMPGLAACTREARRVWLEDRAGLVQHRQLGDVDARHEHPAARNHRHELVAGEALERFADRGATDAETILQDVLADHVAGGELDAHDEVANGVVRPLAQCHAHHGPTFSV
jgi:hypothetical protein